MTLVDRVRNICVSPNTEWPVIAQERTEPATLVTSYLLPLAAIGAVASFIGSSMLRAVLPFGGLGGGIISGLIGACVSILLTIIGCYVIAFIINALAPTFGGRSDFNQAFKTSVYSYTPGLAAGVLLIIPVLGWLVAMIAGLYGLYLLYLGLPVMMQSPKEKAVGYTVIVVVASIVLWFVVTMIMAVLGFAGMMMRG
ncbi:MAG: YIP1 family protein [Acidobacteria bacterium]|nr:YIP1 family protein [Acidobacteriota bacterium]